MEIKEIFFILQIYGNSGIFSARDILRLMVTWFVANDNLDPYKVNNVSYCSGQM